FKWLFVLGIIILALFMGGTLINQQRHHKRVVILGIDAMDAAVTERLLNEGRLPNLAALRNAGSYSRLRTTVPAETVVAFTSVATGVNPGKHGIFDFIMRDPQDHMPYLSLNEVSNTPTGVHITNRRRAAAFWEELSRRRIPSRVFFFPNTFPPDRIEGVMLSGMGVPDITGTTGRFSYYTHDPELADSDSRGRHVSVMKKNGVIMSALYGPKVMRGGREEEARIPFTLHDGEKPGEMVMRIAGGTSVLRKGQWSDWQKVAFNIGLFRKASGMVRFYLASTGDSFSLYATPVNFDPEEPLFSISSPASYSRTAARKYGLYPTLGMPHDTWGLQEGKLSEGAFLDQVEGVLTSRQRILRAELNKFRGGVFFFYFDT
ncbi:MAG TPA: alkaline phosphatase family protein, partial [Candidatus Omnitrophota bacterium]|nr:alkaline phosphatase family protein [Candidatus Omnitrophota bacterium]